MTSHLGEAIKHKTPILNNNILLVFLSWGKCVQSQLSGYYKNQHVNKIDTDIIIFFSGSESSVSTNKGYLHCFFGLGYYYNKFEIKSGNYITDKRELTGIILSDFVYDYLATSKSITFQNEEDIIFTDLIVKVPIDLSSKSNTKRTFIKGTLMRNLFIPYKNIFLEMMDNIKQEESYQINKNGHKILCANWDNFNSILISENMKEEKKNEYINPTAGINNISKGVDGYLKNYFNESDKIKIKQNIDKLKEVYSTIKFDPSYLFSIIENASKYLINQDYSELIQKSLGGKNGSKSLKKQILLSAQERENDIAPWPNEFKLNKKDLLKSPLQVDNIDRKKMEMNLNHNSNLDNEDMERYNTPKKEDFILRNLRPRIVTQKKLPESDMDSIKEILNYLILVIEEDYDMPSIGKAFELAHKHIRNIALYVDYMWEMSKLANIYKRKNPNLGLSRKEKEDLLRKVHRWIEYSSNKNQLMLDPQK
ncbi:MAG: hypothetical protein ACQERB_07105 [Promethearchaeati archaeon]